MQVATRMGDVIRYIIQERGEETLLNEEITLATFLDVAPRMKKESELLRIFLKCNGSKKMFEIKTEPRNEQKKCIESIICEMQDKHWVVSEAAQFVCGEFYWALTGKEWIADVSNNVYQQTGDSIEGRLLPQQQTSNSEAKITSDNWAKTAPQSSPSGSADPWQSTTNAGASGYSGSSMSTGLKVLIGAIIAIFVFAFFSVMSNMNRDTVTIINDDFSMSVGQTAEVRIRSSVSLLTADWNSCVDAEWNNGKSSDDMYYINVTGASPGICTLKIYKTADEDIYDTVVIQVVPADSDIGGNDAGASGSDVTTVPPAAQKHDSKGTAMSISLNSETIDSLDSSDDEDWFTFSLDQPGNVNIAFEHEIANTANYLWDLFLYRDDGSTYYDGGDRFWSVNGDEGRTTCNVGLPAGTYYFRVDAYSSSNWSSNDYYFTVNYEASDVWETEINNSKYDADPIGVNQTYYGTISSSDDEDWFTFSLDQPGNVNIAFEHEAAKTANYLWDMFLYRDDGSTYYDGEDCFWSVNGDEGRTTCNVGLPAGTYYFRVDAYSSSNWSSNNYYFTVNYEASDVWETEINNSKYDADPIGVNQTYYGTISSSNDEDWFTFSLDQPGYVNIAFEHEVANTADYLWDMFLYRDDGSTYYDGEDCYWSVNGDEGRTTCNVGLPVGTYYFRVDAYSSSNWSSNNYYFTVNYEASDVWETEINNDKYDADPIGINQTYYGTISSSDDEDWFTFTLASDGYIGITFNHDATNTANYLWDIYLYGADGSTPATGKDYWSVPGDSAKHINDILLSAGTYYVRIDAYSLSNWSSKNYSLLIG